MAHAKRNDVDHAAGLPDHGAGNRYDAGGHVARLQADLARQLADRRLADHAALERPVVTHSPAERLVRFCSVAGGYGALAAGYVGIAVAIAHWM
jgi:hypothetical protein